MTVAWPTNRGRAEVAKQDPTAVTLRILLVDTAPASQAAAAAVNTIADVVANELSGTGYARRGDGFGWYLFAGVEGRAVAYNAFLDGPWFRASPDVEKKPFVADVQAGAALTWRGFRFAYTYVLRTREFDGQESSDRFGAITLPAGWVAAPHR